MVEGNNLTKDFMPSHEMPAGALQLKDKKVWYRDHSRIKGAVTAKLSSAMDRDMIFCLIPCHEICTTLICGRIVHTIFAGQ